MILRALSGPAGNFAGDSARVAALTQISAEPPVPPHISKMDDQAPLHTKVFVVDDDDAVRDSLKALLEVHGIEVEDYQSTSAFASHYLRPPRGCLILDQHLPVLTGVDF